MDRYRPEPPPLSYDPREITEYMERELRRVSSTLDQVIGGAVVPRGQMYFQDNEQETDFTKGVWALVEGEGLPPNEDQTQRAFGIVEPSRLTYRASNPYVGRIVVTFGVDSNQNEREFSFAVAKNGEVIDRSAVTLIVGTGKKKERVALQTVVLLEAGDYLELWGRNNNHSSNATVPSMQMVVS